jgi:hypothetical protein
MSCSDNPGFQELQSMAQFHPLQISKLENTMRRVIGILLILSPLFALMAFAFLGVLLGSMGVDIHWTSKGTSYVAIACFILALCACVMAGVHLRKN